MNDDIISRSALKKALEVTQYNDIDDLTRTERLIDNATPIEDTPIYRFWKQAYERGKAERPTGCWTSEGFDEWYECSNCLKGDTYFSGLPNFCPNCGADMRGGKK